MNKTETCNIQTRSFQRTSSRSARKNPNQQPPRGPPPGRENWKPPPSQKLPRPKPTSPPTSPASRGTSKMRVLRHRGSVMTSRVLPTAQWHRIPGRTPSCKTSAPIRTTGTLCWAWGIGTSRSCFSRTSKVSNYIRLDFLTICDFKTHKIN